MDPLGFQPHADSETRITSFTNRKEKSLLKVFITIQQRGASCRHQLQRPMPTDTQAPFAKTRAELFRFYLLSQKTKNLEKIQPSENSCSVSTFTFVKVRNSLGKQNPLNTCYSTQKLVQSNL